MSAPNDGGPAFATATCGDFQKGMSLRDWFAGQALAGVDIGEYAGTGWADSLAKPCYQIADAMLKARNGGDQ